MNVDVFCPQCGTLFTIRRELIGKRTKCTKCGNAFTIGETTSGGNAQTSAPSPTASVFPATHAPPPETLPHFNVETTPRASQRQTQPRAFFGIEHDSAHPRFPALRIVARGYEILAILALAVAALLLLMFVIAVIREPSAIAAAVLASGLTFFWTTLMAMTLLVMAQSIRLGLQVEQNTRETQRACRELADHLCSIETEP